MEALAPRQSAPRLERGGGKLQRAGRVVVGHSRRVGGHGCGGGQRVQQNQARAALGGLRHGERHQAAQVRQIRGHQHHRRMNPARRNMVRAAILAGIRHGLHLNTERVAPKKGAEMCQGAPAKVI